MSGRQVYIDGRLVSETEAVVPVSNSGFQFGYSVYEVLRAFERASGKTIPFEVTERRPGDAAESFADPSKANEELDWRGEYDLHRMCVDAWRWQEKHPQGY